MNCLSAVLGLDTSGSRVSHDLWRYPRFLLSTFVFLTQRVGLSRIGTCRDFPVSGCSCVIGQRPSKLIIALHFHQNPVVALDNDNINNYYYYDLRALDSRYQSPLPRLCTSPLGLSSPPGAPLYRQYVGRFQRAQQPIPVHRRHIHLHLQRHCRRL